MHNLYSITLLQKNSAFEMEYGTHTHIIHELGKPRKEDEMRNTSLCHVKLHHTKPNQIKTKQNICK